MLVKTRRAEHRHTGPDEMQRAKPAHELEKNTDRPGELGSSPLRSLEKAHHFGCARRRAPAIQRNDLVISFLSCGNNFADRINMRNERNGKDNC